MKNAFLSCGLIAALLALLCITSPAVAQDKPAPIKVYILSGQSNMVGIGQVNPSGMSKYATYLSKEDTTKKNAGSTLSIYQGAYDPAVNYDTQTAVETHTVKLGYWPHTGFPKIEGEQTQVARGYIKIDGAGRHTLRISAGAVLEVNGQVVHDTLEDKSAEPKVVNYEKGVYPIKATFAGPGRSIINHQYLDTPGALHTVVKGQGKYPELLDENGEWTSRDDVWYKGLVTAKANKWLSIGCGAKSSTIGPELGIGWALGDYHDEPVLLLKTSQGNRSLGWDFLPPGSERVESVEYEDAKRIAKTGKMTKRNAKHFKLFKGFKDLDVENSTLEELYDAKFEKTETPDGKSVYEVAYIYAGYKDSPGKWFKGTEPQGNEHYAGRQYDECFDAAKDVLANFDANFPHWEGRGYEIAGFAWWQGHKDAGAVHSANYEKNLVHLINTLRSEFKAPNAPFVVATVGFGGFEGMNDTYNQIASAQLAVGDATKHPQFKGNVKSVETRGLWQSHEQSPKNQGFHYHQNGEVYLNVGQAMGKAMVELLKGE